MWTERKIYVQTSQKNDYSYTRVENEKNKKKKMQRIRPHQQKKWKKEKKSNGISKIKI